MAEPITIRERILQAIETLLAARRGVETYGDDYPVRALFEGEDETQAIEYGYTEVVMPVRVEEIDAGAGEDKRDWWQQGNSMCGALIAAATGGDRTLGGLCQGIDYTGGGPVLPQDGSHTVAAVVDLRVRYRFVTGDPYSNEVN